MRVVTHLSLWGALLCVPLHSTASTTQRCEDAAGNIMFTALGCPEGHSSQSQKISNTSSGSQTGPRTSSDARRSEKPKSPAREIVVVGARDDGCENRLSADQRRRAIINQRTPPGMTVRDVESLLGRPDKVVNNNGELRYVYNQKKGRSSSVTFDEHGCVKGKR